jgi:glutathione S-transferase
MTPILHHYPTSPYAELIRLAFGIKRLDWLSAVQPNIMPRPALTPLTGGYRRIPVLQVGADVYCDTHAILRALDRLYPDQPLVPEGQAAVAWGLRAWAERSWFPISVAVIFGAIGRHVPEAFIKDREQLSGRPFDVKGMASVAPMMAGQWRANAQLLEAQLAGGGPFLLGVTPTLADLACYLNVWFLRRALTARFEELTSGFAALRIWVERMSDIGHGSSTDISAEAALGLAASSTPAAALESDLAEAQGLKPGDQVIVMADDYGRDPIAGRIHHIRAQEIALWRETQEAGQVVTHFPRAGFLVRPV